MIDNKIINPVENKKIMDSSVENLSNKESIEKILNENENIVQDIKHSSSLATESIAIYPGAQPEDINAVKEIVEDINTQLDLVQKDFNDQYNKLISSPTKYKSSPGESMLEVANKTIELADTFNGIVNAIFDDVEITINPGDTPETVVKKIVEARYTPEFIAQKGYTLETLADKFMGKETEPKTEEGEKAIEKAKTIVDNFFLRMFKRIHYL